MRDSILDQSKLAFADHGFDGVGLREIAQRAQVNAALIGYYFGTKRNLFDEVFLRRGRLLAKQRNKLLDDLTRQEASPAVEDVVHAYLYPQWAMKHSGPGGEAFIQIQARIHAAIDEDTLRLRREVYDAPLNRYIDALARIQPAIPRDIIAVRMAFVVGAYLFMLSDLGRIEDLIAARTGYTDEDSMLQELVTFLAAGIRAGG